MKRSLVLILVVPLLLFVDWLSFHDFFEPHTVRDYLTLVASLLVFLRVGLDYWPGFPTSGRKA